MAVAGIDFGGELGVPAALTRAGSLYAAGATPLTTLRDGTLHLEVRDDGVGGARPDGSGLVGLADRLAVLDGQLRVESPSDGGTLVTADVPLRSWHRHRGRPRVLLTVVETVSPAPTQGMKARRSTPEGSQQ
jgi:hypothetical protein